MYSVRQTFYYVTVTARHFAVTSRSHNINKNVRGWLNTENSVWPPLYADNRIYNIYLQQPFYYLSLFFVRLEMPRADESPDNTGRPATPQTPSSSVSGPFDNSPRKKRSPYHSDKGYGSTNSLSSDDSSNGMGHGLLFIPPPDWLATLYYLVSFDVISCFVQNVH